MKHIIFLLISLMAPLCLHPAFAQDAQTPATGSNAETASVMNQYFGALVNGDTGTLKTLLAGDLLEKRSSLLDNPEYSGFLSATYMNASFKILNYDTSDPNIVRIDALITLDQDETIQKQYTLTKSTSASGVATYRIISEKSSAVTF